MKKYIPLSLLLIFLLSVSVSMRSTVDVVKIGLNAELSGSMPLVGRSCARAASIAVDEVNARGGVWLDGKKRYIELLVEDNEDKAESASVAMQKLIYKDKVVAVIGPNASRNAVPAASIAEENRVIMISPWATNMSVTSGKKYIFRACFTDKYEGALCAAFAIDSLKSNRAAVLYDIGSEYNRGLAREFINEYKRAGGVIVSEETYASLDQDFQSQLTRIISRRPDLIFLPNYYSEVPLQMLQARRLGFNGVFLGSDSWGFPELLKLGNQEIEGAFYISHYAGAKRSYASSKFCEAYLLRYAEEPDDVAALTYDSFCLLFKAFENSKSCAQSDIADSLRRIVSFEGVTGEMDFSFGNDPVKSAFVMVVKDEKAHLYTKIQSIK